MKTSRILSLLLFVSTTCLAGDIDKAYKSLNAGDYANALKFLREVLVDDYKNSLANYGMAKYYFLKDNKMNNLDSANYYIKSAVKYYVNNPDNKDTKKGLSLGVRDFTIKELMKSINAEAFSSAETKNTVEAYQYYLDNFTDDGYRMQATRLRNQKALIQARAKNDYKALLDYIQHYPDASDIAEVKDEYEKLLYQQLTVDRSATAYKKYIDEYPMGKYIQDARNEYNNAIFAACAQKRQLVSWIQFSIDYPNHPRNGDVQDTIYSMATEDGTIESYRNFIKGYKKNKNLLKAWNQLYVLYTATATETVYEQFAAEFPDFPDKARLKKDKELSKLELKPFQRNGKWGYAEQPRPDSINVVLPFEYDEAFEFSCGFAAVRVKPCANDKCTYYYIDKGGNKAFNKSFNEAGNFINGLAIVGVGNCSIEDSCMYGVINKAGEFLIDPDYDVIEEASEGFFLASRNGRFGYIDLTGEEVISMKYTDGLSFKQGVAAVSLDGNWFFIDVTGRQLFISRFADVSSFNDSLCAVTEDDVNWGYINMSGEMVIQPIYESAEDFIGGFAIVSKREKDPKIKDAFVSQRYKIDRSGKVIEKITAPKDIKSAAPSNRKSKRK